MTESMPPPRNIIAETKELGEGESSWLVKGKHSKVSVVSGHVWRILESMIDLLWAKGRVCVRSLQMSWSPETKTVEVVSSASVTPWETPLLLTTLTSARTCTDAQHSNIYLVWLKMPPHTHTHKIKINYFVYSRSRKKTRVVSAIESEK